MKVLKFGGSSLANPARFRDVADISSHYATDTSVILVLSAPQGVTNDLVALVSAAQQDGAWQAALDSLQARFEALIIDAEPALPESERGALLQGARNQVQVLADYAKGIALLQHCPDPVQARMLGTGEQFSVALMTAALKARGLDAGALDATGLVKSQGDYLNAGADIPATVAAFAERKAQGLPRIAVMAGFVSGLPNGETALLGRNGSDYSAAIIAAGCKAEVCEIWTDVDGVYSADPRQVKGARLVDALSYAEAMELSYFGAKVLHPKTIGPLAQAGIPCVIRNTLNPSAPGTRIGTDGGSDRVKGISSLEDLALLTLSGPGLKGVVGMASRTFAAMAREQVSVNLITQSSSEFSISFCIAESDLKRATAALQAEFELELQAALLDPLGIETDMAIVSLVGDGMRQSKGMAAKFFASLAQARVNVVAIAQGSSERSISAVIQSRHCADAIKVCHENFFTHVPSIDVFLVGCGVIGGELLDQFHRQKAFLAARQVKLCVYGIANSKRILLDKQGIDLADWKSAMAASTQAFTREALVAFVHDNHLTNPVLIDCTSAQAVADQYVDYLAAGFHVVTPNKKANTGTMAYYRELRATAQSQRRRFLYETTVGAGLPVIDTLQGLFNAGDALLSFEGILSGTLSYVFGLLEEGVPLSEVTAQAKQLGYTETDPREDLSGMDVARKLLVIAREAGLVLDLSDVVIEPVLPAGFAEGLDVPAFMAELPKLDAAFAERVQRARERGEVLRYIGEISEGRCKVAIKALPVEHPLAKVKDGENALAIQTRYYQPIPFVLRGYGAGARVTAAGVFSDLMRTLGWQQGV
jgi:bifunctional aspartokinase / homoserine dehydrogenase 1